MADDLSADQNAKLAHFQEITGIESVNECRQILEVFEWNIESAVQSTFGDQIGASVPSSNSSSSTSLFNQPSSSANASSSSLAASATPHAPFNSPLTSNHNSFHSSSSSPNRAASNHQLPNVNIHTQRTLSYNGRQQEGAVVPRGLVGWSMFIISFPFKFILSSLVELANFFYSLFHDPNRLLAIDYDPLANVAEFVIDYNQKYGTNHVDFYQGSYAQAVNEAKRDLRFLLVYIHQNENKDCNMFASETMSNPEVMDFLGRQNFIVWACTKNLSEGLKVHNALKVRRCPFLGLIVPRSGRMTLVSKIEGPISAAELLLQLANLVADYEPELVAARHDREQRSQTQLLRQQQDQAYLESLKADREKARKKQEQEEEARRVQELEQKRIDEEEARKNNLLNQKSEWRKWFAETALQPDASDSQAIKLVFKLPTGTRTERVFLKTDPLSLLFKFVFSHEECPLNLEIVKNFPRQVITCDQTTETTISEFGINQPMLLFVNDLDA